MNALIKAALAVIIVVLIYLVYQSISEPMKQMEETAKRERAVIERLEKIRDAQLAYKDLKGEFTKDWDQLIETMKNGKFKVLIKEGDEDDSTTVVRLDSVFVSIKDSLFKNFNLDSLPFVPYENVMFELDAGKITERNVTVPVFEVKDPKPYSKKRQEEKNPLKVGSMFEGTYSGNW